MIYGLDGQNNGTRGVVLLAFVGSSLCLDQRSCGCPWPGLLPAVSHSAPGKAYVVLSSRHPQPTAILNTMRERSGACLFLCGPYDAVQTIAEASGSWPHDVYALDAAGQEFALKFWASQVAVNGLE